jgi:hypothetical protein
VHSFEIGVFDFIDIG